VTYTIQPESRKYKIKKLPGMLIAIFILIHLAVGGCSFFFDDGNTHTYQQFMMDTNVQVQIVADSKEQADRASQKVFKAMEELEQELDRGVKNSDVWKINQNAGHEPVQVNPETVEVIEKGKEIGEETGGAFDITIAPLVDLWGFYDPEGDDFEERARVPSEGEIKEVLPLVDYTKVELDRENQEVYLPESPMQLELGGIAKGYVVERGAEILREEGIDNAFINAGDIRVIGNREDGNPWKIGIREPHSAPEDNLARFKLSDAGVDTSGNYERYFKEEGTRYHHILDPETGYPARGLDSATGISSNTARADALSTASFIMGPREGLDFIEDAPDLEGVLVTEEGEMLTSSGMEEKYQLEILE